MAKPERDSQEERRAFLSAAPAEPRERRLALWTLGLSSLIFLAAIPFAKVQLPPYPAFIAAYQSALAVSDLVTAALLFAQFKLLGSRALLALASGYLFTALMAVAHALTFPGLLAPTGLLGAGPQSTAWMYMFWHAGFPALAVVYAFASAPGAAEKRSTRPALAASIAAVALATVGFTLLATTGASLLPPIMQDNRYTPAMIVVVGGVWALSALALVVLWRKRPADRARPLADGGDVRVAVRYRARGGLQRRALRPGLLRRPHLRPRRGLLRPASCCWSRMPCSTGGC